MNWTFLATIASATLLLSACGNSSNGSYAPPAPTETTQQAPVAAVPAAPAYEPPAATPAPVGVVARDTDSNQIIGLNGQTTGPEGATKESAPSNLKSIGFDGADVGKPSD